MVERLAHGFPVVGSNEWGDEAMSRRPEIREDVPRVREGAQDPRASARLPLTDFDLHIYENLKLIDREMVAAFHIGGAKSA